MNRLFDRLGHGHIDFADRRFSLYLLCQIIGVLVALMAAVLLSLAKGLPLSLIAAMAVLCVAAYAIPLLLHRWLLRSDAVVVMEHLWTGLALNAGLLLLLGVTPWPYLDLLATCAAFGLACGRVGCSLGGCCHGLPSSWGIAYPEGSWGPPSSRWKNGLRLFPVQLIESAILLGIGLAGAMLLLFAPAGAALTWFLAAYALMRFATEFLRGDRRPQLFGVSQAQWMSVVQFGAAFLFDPARQAERPQVIAGLMLGIALSAGLGYLIVRARRERYCQDQALRLRETVLDAAGRLPTTAPAAGDTRMAGPIQLESGELGVFVQWAEPERSLRVSIKDTRFATLRARCHCLAAALPELEPAAACLGKESILHLRLAWPIAGAGSATGLLLRPDAESKGDWIYRRALQNRQLREASLAPEIAAVAPGDAEPGIPARADIHR